MSKAEVTEEWFSSLSSTGRESWEGIAKTHLRSIVEERPEILFPAFELVSPSSIYTQVRHRRHFTYEDIQQTRLTISSRSCPSREINFGKIPTVVARNNRITSIADHSTYANKIRCL